MLTVDVRRHQGVFQVDCSFSSVATGVTALFGPSGSGKTSVVNMVAGLTSPDEGHILLNGHPLVDTAKKIMLPMERRRIGYVFQDGRLFPHLTVRRNLRYGMDLTPRKQRTIAFDDVISLLGIEHLLDRRPAKLSGGEKQRVAIGRALLTSPHLLLMDEPLAALDSNRKDEVLPFIAHLPKKFSIPILYVTHSMEEILRLADQLVLMDQGKSAAVGAVEDLLNRPELRPLTGRFDPGCVVSAHVSGHDETYAITTLSCDGGTLMVPRADLPLGALVRVRILAREVSLSLSHPSDTSIRNIFAGKIVSIDDKDQTQPQVDIHLDCGIPLMSSITRRAMADLQLKLGQSVYAMVKAASIARDVVGPHETV